MKSLTPIFPWTLLLIAAGCAVVPFTRHTGPPVTSPASAAEIDTTAALADSAGNADSSASHTGLPRKPRPPRPAAPPRAEVIERPDTTKAPQSTEPASKEVDPDRAISVEMPVQERARLESSCHADLTAAEKIVTGLASRGLSQEDADKIQTVNGLIAQSRDAIAKEDIQGAANLAHKARVLAEEMANQ